MQALNEAKDECLQRIIRRDYHLSEQVEGGRRPVTGDSHARGPETRTPDSWGPLARTLVARAGTAARPSFEHGATNDVLRATGGTDSDGAKLTAWCTDGP
jgi:hypothetical protein